MMADEAEGVLGIWHDIREGRTADFEFWYRSEHFPERLGVPGFRVGRRFEAAAGAPRYLCYYLADTPEVFTSAAYVERLNNPTPLTHSMMSDAFFNMNRTVCRRIRRYGDLFGALCVTARFQEPIDHARALPMLETLVATEGIARGELWEMAERQDAIAAEEKLRGGDRKIAACIMVEALRLSDAERVRDELQREFGADAEIGIYRLLCQLTSAPSKT